MKCRAQEIFYLLKESYPVAKPMLNFGNTFQLLVATILSAQTTDEQVNRITGGLFTWVKGPEDLACLQPEQLEVHLKGCGLFRNKSRFLIAASQKILNEFAGRVPAIFEDLITLPGVGRKTANVVLSAGFGIPAFAVDTHVYRVSRRLGLAEKKTAGGVEQELKEKVAPEEWLGAHRRLIIHGRQVCKARNPRCGCCVLSHCCPSAKLTAGSKGEER